MAISYPLTFPTQTGIASVNLHAINSVAISQSPFTYKQQVVAHTGQRWEAEVSLPPMKRDDAEVWIAFLLSLKGMRGTFLMGDPNCATARGSASTAAGTPVVNGADQTGDNLTIDGLPVSATGYLLAGDYIQIGSGSTARLYKVLQDVNTNASGQATLNLWPDLRSSPNDNSSVAVSNAKGVFRLSQNDVSWIIDKMGLYSITFAASEAL